MSVEVTTGLLADQGIVDWGTYMTVPMPTYHWPTYVWPNYYLPYGYWPQPCPTCGKCPTCGR